MLFAVVYAMAVAHMTSLDLPVPWERKIMNDASSGRHGRVCVMVMKEGGGKEVRESVEAVGID